ncbi:TPA: hypothetical protein QDB23_005492 [Burkholderia vietnamiensis]|nr:hypothetical protein [Burkholderia vietnamiensis]
MKQVIFGAVQQSKVSSTVKAYALALLTMLSVGNWGGGHQSVARASPRQSAQFPRQSGRKPLREYASNVVLWSITHCFILNKYWVCNVSTTSSSRWRYVLVAFPAHACNAKKILGYRISDGTRLRACNVTRAGHFVSKFQINIAVTRSVNRLFDCIVYDRPHFTTLLGRLGLATSLTRFAAFVSPSIRPWLMAGGAR